MDKEVVVYIYIYVYIQTYIYIHKWNIQFSSVAQLCPTLSDPMDYSLPGSSVHGIFQVRILEWGAIAFSTDLLITSNFLPSKIPQVL